MTIRNKLIAIGDSLYFQVLTNELKGYQSVLDVGCGKDSPLKKVKCKICSTGIDIFKKSIIESRKKKIHNKYVLGDIRHLPRYFKPKSIDAVVALDVIEHLDKKEALQLIRDMERIAKIKVILLTPNGFCHQDDYDSNPYQVHKTGWSKMDLENLGYRIFGLRGWKTLRGQRAEIKYKPWIFWGFCSFLSERLLYHFPSLSFDLLAVKKIAVDNG